jgi:hypothetical protein
MKRLFGFVLLLSFFPFTSYNQIKKNKLSEKEKITILIRSIDELKNAKFYRNGNLYDSKTAAEHLKMKWTKAGNNIKTAEEFIEEIASKSSLSGKDYKIIFENGNEILVKKFLYDKLKTL